jgi:hypothetical protein
MQANKNKLKIWVINDELKLVNFVQTSAHTEIGDYYFSSSTTTFFGDDTLY